MQIFTWVGTEIGVIVDSVQVFFARPGMQLVKWVAGAVLLYYAYRVIVPTWRILALSLYRDLPWSLSRSFVDLIHLGWLGIGRDNWYYAARVRVEWELLQPRPDPPPRHLALPRHGELLSAAKARFAERRRQYRDDLANWKERLKAHLAPATHSGRENIVIDVADCSQIYARAAEIRNYFGVLATDRSTQRAGPHQFVSKVRVDRGFVAPLHLVAGLLNECEEQWAPVIQDYGRQVASPTPSIAQAHGRHAFAGRDAELKLQRLQAFLFDCWLLWGPSIPICTCEAWTPGRAVLQFGFGDENNSIAMMLNNAVADDQLIGFFRGERVRGFSLAVKTTNVVGRLQWGPSVAPGEIAEAQQSLCSPEEERLALLVDGLPLYSGGDHTEASARYYSAYLWLMFVVCKPGFEPLYPDGIWRGILPFFEHGNIAEPQSLALAKRQLAVKTLTTVQVLLDEMPNLHLRFVCAIDQSCCGSQLLLPAPAGDAMHELLRQAIDANDAFSRLRPGGPLASRLLIETSCWREGEYCSCHLPHTVQAYYGSLDQSADGANPVDTVDASPTS